MPETTHPPKTVTVRIAAEAGSMRVTIDDPAAAPNTRYAIYLVRNGERVAVRGYACDREARFLGPHAAGRYVATGFCHDVDTDVRRKAYSKPLAYSRPPPPPRPKDTEVPDPETVESIDALYAQLRPDLSQRLDVCVGKLKYCILTGEKRNGRLFVLLRGAEPNPRKVLPRFSRFSWRDEFPGTVVCIADPTLYLDDDLLLGWYFGSPDHDVVGHVARIVEVICGKLGLAVADSVFYGSSGGGFAALQCAARLGRGATAIAINPQIEVLRYAVLRSVDNFLRVCTEGQTREGAAERFGMRLSAILAWQREPAGEARALIVQNTVDREHYRNHFRPFADLFGLPDNGQAAGHRIASIVYQHPNGHAAEPQEMLPQILKTALALRWAPGTPAVRAGVQAPVATTAPPPAAGRPRIPIAPLVRPPAVTGAPIRLAQLYQPTTATRAGSRPGTILYRPRADVPAYELKLPLDWSVNPFKDRNWNAQLHMWRLGDFALIEAEQMHRTESLEIFKRIMLDWHRYHLVEGRPSIYAWQDMMVGFRAMKLAYVLSRWQHRRLDLTDAEVEVLRELVETHLGFLLDPAELRYSNHTLSDLHGALALARVVDASARARIEAFVGEVLPRVIDAQFDADGIHRENSVGYHRYGINYLRRLIDSGWYEAFGLREVVARAEAALDWFVLPDSRLAPVGDTDGDAPPERSGPTAFSGRDQAFSRSGYVVLRDDGGGDASKAAYLLLMGAYNSKFHKQSDDLSLIWYHGEDILCDAGKYAYKTDDSWRYAISRRAHNTVEIDTPAGPQLPTTIYGSAIRAVETFDGGRLIRACVAFEDLGVVHHRTCLHSLDGWLLVVDHVEAKGGHDYTQWWHLAPKIVDASQHRDGIDTRLPSGRHLAIRHVGSGPTTVNLLRGVEKPRRQGWISQAYRQLEPNFAVGMHQFGSDVWFATLLAIDAPDALLQSVDGALALRIGAGDAPAVQLTIHVGPDRCVVQQHR
jgi:Heparinase II/III-like protein